MRVNIAFKNLVLIGVLALCSGCGYSWQNRGLGWAESSVHKVYIRTLINNSLRAGIEVPFTSAIVKAFSRGNKVQVVSNPDLADGFIEGSVDNITGAISSSTTAPSLTQDQVVKNLDNFVVATEYSASANINVRLIRKKDGMQIWSQPFARSKIYPGNNRVGLPGTTSVLINDSQMQMALQDIAAILAGDVYDTMCEAF